LFIQLIAACNRAFQEEYEDSQFQEEGKSSPSLQKLYLFAGKKLSITEELEENHLDILLIIMEKMVVGIPLANRCEARKLGLLR